MDPSLQILLQIIFFGVSLFLIMYLLMVKGPLVKKTNEWAEKGRKARKKRRNETPENNEKKEKIE